MLYELSSRYTPTVSCSKQAKLKNYVYYIIPYIYISLYIYIYVFLWGKRKIWMDPHEKVIICYLLREKVSGLSF